MNSVREGSRGQFDFTWRLGMRRRQAHQDVSLSSVERKTADLGTKLDGWIFIDHLPQYYNSEYCEAILGQQGLHSTRPVSPCELS